MKTIYYLCYYNAQNSKQNRITAIAANNKLDYIFKKLFALGYRVKVISAGGSSGSERYPASVTAIDDGIELIQFKTIGRKNTLFKALDKALVFLQIICYFFRNIRSDSIVFTYHSLGYMRLVSYLKKRLHFRLIYEVEELYADVFQNKRVKKQEIFYTGIADAFLFPTEQLNQMINVAGKPHAIIHGTYQAEEDRNHNIFCADQTEKDNKIHCVYAGTLDPRKGGALVAVEAAQYLPEQYQIHIIGGGSEQDKEMLLCRMEEVNRAHQASVSYDGLLSGEDFIEFLQSCDIGLSTQNPKLDFNASSFPSKILTYLANGLHVVSTPVSVVETSTVHSAVTYCENVEGKKIAEAILSIDLQEHYDSRALIADLDQDFKRELCKVLNNNA